MVSRVKNHRTVRELGLVNAYRIPLLYNTPRVHIQHMIFARMVYKNVLYTNPYVFRNSSSLSWHLVAKLTEHKNKCTHRRVSSKLHTLNGEDGGRAIHTT